MQKGRDTLRLSQDGGGGGKAGACGDDGGGGGVGGSGGEQDGGPLVVRPAKREPVAMGARSMEEEE